MVQEFIEMAWGHKSEDAMSGELAVMACQKRMDQGLEMYRLIVMDINMPGMDGNVA